MTAPQKKAHTKEEIKFLAGPQSRVQDFKFAVSVLFEFIKGFRALHFVGPCVTIFGSARFKDGHPYFEKTEELAGRIAQLGFTIMTGGGPGIMEAANKGAKQAGGRSVGCNIVLPHEQQHNPYLDKWVNIKYLRRGSCPHEPLCNVKPLALQLKKKKIRLMDLYKYEVRQQVVAKYSGEWFVWTRTTAAERSHGSRTFSGEWFVWTRTTAAERSHGSRTFPESGSCGHEPRQQNVLESDLNISIGETGPQINVRSKTSFPTR